MAKQELYPLTFELIVKDKIWGGTRLKDILGKKIDSDTCGETWELSGVKDNVSVVANGYLKGSTLNELINKFGSALLGKKVIQKYGSEFPLLVKFIDANRDLSIQVHPNDEQAKKFNSFGKTELWYILHADKGAHLISGFNKNLSKDEFSSLLEEGNILDVLHEEDVEKGDVYFMPAGRIHNIGGGMMIAEIQQSSDITFRIHDFDRADLNGEKRELHIEDALEVLDFTPTINGKTEYQPAVNQLVNLVKCEQFITNKINFDTTIIRDFSSLDSFIIYVCLKGELKLSAEDHEMLLKAGDVYLIPAFYDSVTLQPNIQSLVLEAYIG